MLYGKALRTTLADLVFQVAKDTPTGDKDYFMYIYDVCCYPGSQEEFYDERCNHTNTWNFSLRDESLQKATIMRDSPGFGFGEQSARPEDTHVIVKANDVRYSGKPGGQAHVAPVSDTGVYDAEPGMYVKQAILRTSPDSPMSAELNVFLLRDLDTRELKTYCVLIQNDTRVNINRKKSNIAIRPAELSILGELEKPFIEYMDSINIDFGRVELLKDHKRGWCVLDINSTPGAGPLSRHAYPILGRMLSEMVSKT